MAISICIHCECVLEPIRCTETSKCNSLCDLHASPMCHLRLEDCIEALRARLQVVETLAWRMEAAFWNLYEVTWSLMNVLQLLATLYEKE